MGSESEGVTKGLPCRPEKGLRLCQRVPTEAGEGHPLAPGPATSPKLAPLKDLWVEREGNQRCPEARGVTPCDRCFLPPHPSQFAQATVPGPAMRRKGPNSTCFSFQL